MKLKPHKNFKERLLNLVVTVDKIKTEIFPRIHIKGEKVVDNHFLLTQNGAFFEWANQDHKILKHRFQMRKYISLKLTFEIHTFLNNRTQRWGVDVRIYQRTAAYNFGLELEHYSWKNQVCSIYNRCNQVFIIIKC